MVDIVERLRKHEIHWAIFKEAADEIERLREQERKMTNHALERMEEIERLREAHEKIIAMANKPNKRIRDAVVISQAALQQKESE